MLRDGLLALVAFVGYYALAASLLLGLRLLLGLSGEPFRKLLHLAFAMSIFVLLGLFQTWQLATLAAILCAILVYPALFLLELYPPLLRLLEERWPGELRSSLALAFLMIALLVTLLWGWLGSDWRFVVVLSVLTWGFGDAAAALVGTTRGRRPLRLKWVDSKKTAEGTLAMLVVSAATLLTGLTATTNLPWSACLLVAAVVSPICATVELLSKEGSDTFTVPVATATATAGILHLLSWLGVIA